MHTATPITPALTAALTLTPDSQGYCLLFTSEESCPHVLTVTACTEPPQILVSVDEQTGEMIQQKGNLTEIDALRIIAFMGCGPRSRTRARRQIYARLARAAEASRA